MFVARAVPSPLSRVNTGIATTTAYTVAHVAARRYSVRTPSSIQARVGLLSGNPWTPPMSQPRKMTAFSCTGQRYCVLAAMRTWGMYSTMALSQPVCAIASIPDHSSSIGERTIYKRSIADSIALSVGHIVFITLRNKLRILAGTRFDHSSFVQPFKPGRRIICRG